MPSIHPRIADRSATIGVLGLGTVGVTVAVALAEAGFEVIGVDVDAGRVRRVEQGECPVAGDEPELAELLRRVVRAGRLRATGDYAPLGRADVVLVAVDTPVGPDRRPLFDTLRAACTSLGRVMKPGVLVVVESTLAPGTCEDVVKPSLQAASGLSLGEGFFLGHCPERVMPGRLLRNLRELPRACGGMSPGTSEAMVALYSTIVRGRLEPCDCATAEVAKTAENAVRDVNIAFANELALVCERVGVDFRRVRELVNQSPGRDVLMAGAGVGGHCIPKDSWLLAHPLRDGGGPEVDLLAAARAVNDGMPAHVGRLVEDALREGGIALRGAKIALLGYAYLPDSGDTRNSPTQALASRLVDAGATVVVHDPWVPAYDGDLHVAAQGASAVVIMVAHAAYRELDLDRLGRVVAHRILVDGRFVVEPRKAREAGFVFRGVGRGGR